MIKDEYREINLKDLHKDDDYKYRQEINVSDLEVSLKKDGQLVPIVVRPFKDKYQLISGFRRTQALSNIGQKTVQAKVLYGLSDSDAQRISLIENLERDSLTAWDQVATAAKFREQGMKNQEIADAFNVAVRTIQRYLVVAKAPIDFRKALQIDDITIQQAYEAISKGVPLSELLGPGRSVRYLRRLTKGSGKITKDQIRIKHKRDGEILINICFRPKGKSLESLFQEVLKKLEK